MNRSFILSDQSVIFTTRSFAIIHNLSVSAASHQLTRMCSAELLTPISRGIWANTQHPHFSVLSCIPKLLGAEQGYLSFLSALHLHGAISQIPATIQIATTGRGRKLQSTIGTFEFFQIKPELMQQGIEWSESRIPYRVATIEKATFDTLYLATRKGRRFAALPEYDRRVLNEKKFLTSLNQSKLSAQIKGAITKRFFAL